MDFFNPNFSQALDQVPPGFYSTIIDKIDPYTSKANTPCVRVTNKITEGPYVDRTIPIILPLEGKAAGFFRQFIKAIIPEYNEGPVDPKQIVGKLLRLKVAHSTYPNGARSYLKVTPFPMDYVEATPCSSEQNGSTP